MSGKPTYKELEKRIQEFEQKEYERRQLEGVLKEREDELSAIYNNSTNIIILVDEDHRVLKTNQQALKATNRQTNEILGLHVGEALRCIHSADPAGCGFGVNCEECIVRTTVLDSLRTGHLHKNIEAAIQLFIDDEIVDLCFLISTSPLNIGGKKSVLVCLEDITAPKIAEKKIKESETLFRTIFEQAPVGIAIVDSTTGRFLHINETYCRIVGYNSSEMLEADFMQITHPDDLQEDLDNMARLRAGEIAGFQMEKRYIRKNQQTVWGSLTVAPLWDKKEKKLTHMAIIEDITERKNAEDRLRELAKEAQTGKDTLNTLIETAPVGVVVADTDGTISFHNQAAKDIVGGNISGDARRPESGYQLAYVDGTPFAEEDLPLVRTIRDNKLIRDTELLIRRDDGKDIVVLVDSTPLRDEKGNVRGAIAVMQDITNRKLAEEERRKSDERFRIAQEMSPDGFTILRPVRDDQDRVIDFTWIYENEAVARMNGTDPEKIVGQRLLDLFPGHQGTQFFNTYKKVAETGKSITFEDKYVGETIEKPTWFRTVVVPMAENIAILNHDITDRRTAEENLINTFNLSPSIIAKANLKTGLFTEANPAVTRILGYSIEEFTSIPIKEFIHPDDIEATNNAMSEQLVGKRAIIENRFLCKNGSYKWISWNANNADDEGIVLGVGSDVTERKKLQEDLNQAQKMESIGTLAGGIAHDFNNILTSIMGFTELALEEIPEGVEIEDSLQEVYSAAQRAKELVSHILAFARKSEEKTTPIKPSTISKEVLSFIRSTIPTSIEIKQKIESKSWIMGNATQMHQVLMNLCTNASHAMEDSGGVLQVSMRDVTVESNASLNDIAGRDHIEIQVSDTGTGIDPDIIESIFEPYFTTKKVGEGTGMGLAMAQGVIGSYGGQITVDSQLGKGTTFTICLPITKTRLKTDTYVPENLPTGTERILFVDDEAPIVKFVSRMLDQLGYSVSVRTSSTEALELFKAKPNDFDLVVTDMTMPNLTGDKLAIELIKIRSDIPVILCTGYSKKISDESTAGIGIKALVYKPVVKADLAKAVRKILDEANS